MAEVSLARYNLVWELTRTQELTIDSYILFGVRCQDFKELQAQFESEICFHHIRPPDTYGVLALKSIDLTAMKSCAEIEIPYNPTAPDRKLVDEHGAEVAKMVMRKNFLDRWCRRFKQRHVLTAILYNMAPYFPEDVMWMLNYSVTRSFAVELTEKPLVVTDFKLLGVRIHSSDSEFRSALKKQGFDQDKVLSIVCVTGNLYELWVSKAVVQAFRSNFDVQGGFDPIQCAGVFDIAKAQECLLKRIQKLGSGIQQLYLYYLKLERPEIHQWIIEKLWRRSEGISSKWSFSITSIGGYRFEIPLSSRQNVWLTIHIGLMKVLTQPSRYKPS